ncbi:hypothetical protein AB0A74_35195 [Saccharothrix sp. NPDC042600]|uniref:hypothetical protein n=1 Tax=Saccharothrix TaxID=2071 RepID=UPI0034087A04|nr:hypothetical protein GCM10017745_34010 [Saccharothrix mutabilis subsp. capreolus]
MRTLDELESWLARHDDFVDARLASFEAGDGRVTLVLRRTVVHSAVPGEPTADEVHELVAEEVVEFVPPHDHSPDHHMPDLQAGEGADHLHLVAFVPGRLRVAAKSFTERHVDTEWSSVRPYVSEREFTVLALPDGGFWTARVSAALGVEVVWRAHGGGARRPGQDPDGCFLQTVAALGTTVGGVWCSRGTTRTTFVRRTADDALWHAVRTVAAEAGPVRTGNCVLGPEDWLRHLDSGVLPPPERLVTEPPG